jgi:HEAT repeat protein
MLAELERMSLSPDWVERARAAQLVTRLDPGASEAIVLRLLMDSDSIPVAEAMVASLLNARREAGIALVLRALGRRRATGQPLLEGLLNSELDDVDVRGTVVSVLLATEDGDEVVGALGAIAWLAPGGNFPASPDALDRVVELTEHSEEAIRVLAAEALTALAR